MISITLPILLLSFLSIVVIYLIVAYIDYKKRRALAKHLAQDLTNELIQRDVGKVCLLDHGKEIIVYFERHDKTLIESKPCTCWTGKPTDGLGFLILDDSMKK